MLVAGFAEKAVDLFKNILASSTPSPAIHNNLGYALLSLGRAQVAIGHFEEAIRLRPGFTLAEYNLGDALARVGRNHEAARVLHNADWRWLKDRTDRPWYPTIKLFRQTEPGNWTPVIEQVSEELKRLRMP